MSDYAVKADLYINTLCGVTGGRRTGSPGNEKATDFFANTIRSFGYEIDVTPFETLDYTDKGSSLTAGSDSYEVFTSPYSNGCIAQAELIPVSNIEDLEQTDCAGRILLMFESICSEQLMPKNFVFYNPDHHQKIISLLESQKPAAIITATERKPEQVGALYPFPLIVDGDFDIPSVYCRETVGHSLLDHQGTPVRLEIRSKRLSSKATNVIASLNRGAPKKVVFTAHIDAYEDSPGASDNASGTVVLLLTAEMLSNYQGESCLEVAALNGEDHYSAGGQMDYLNRYRLEFPSISVAINVDDVGYKEGRSSYSFYECPDQLEREALAIFSGFDGLCQGEQWFNGDHMIFVQNQVPSIAITAERVSELMRTVTHTSEDTPDLIDYRKLVDVAASLNAFARML
jgi:aminopeptidase YwaD